MPTFTILRAHNATNANDLIAQANTGIHVEAAKPRADKPQQFANNAMLERILALRAKGAHAEADVVLDYYIALSKPRTGVLRGVLGKTSRVARTRDKIEYWRTK